MATDSVATNADASLQRLSFRFSIKQLLVAVTSIAVALVCLLNAGPLLVQTAATLVVITLILAILWAIHSRNERRAFWIGFAVCGWFYSHIMGEMLPTTSAITYGPPSLSIRYFLPRAVTDYAYHKLFSQSQVAWTSYPAYSAPTYSAFPSVVAMPPSNPIVSETTIAPADESLPKEDAPPPANSESTKADVDVTTNSSSAPPILVPAGPPQATYYQVPVPPVASYPTQPDFQSIAHSFFTLLFAYCGGVYSAYLRRRRAT